MKGDCVVGVEERLEFSRILQRNIDIVWGFLVQDELRGKWLCRGQVEPFEGGKIEFKFDPENFGQTRPPDFSDSAFKTEIVGQVVTYKPPEKLAFK